MIHYKVLTATVDGKAYMQVNCKSTDDFVLLCHCYDLSNWKINLYLADFSEVKNIISIQDMVKVQET